MFEPFSIRGAVRRFDGPNGWYYLPLGPRESDMMRPKTDARNACFGSRADVSI